MKRTNVAKTLYILIALSLCIAMILSTTACDTLNSPQKTDEITQPEPEKKPLVGNWTASVDISSDLNDLMKFDQTEFFTDFSDITASLQFTFEISDDNMEIQVHSDSLDTLAGNLADRAIEILNDIYANDPDENFPEKGELKTQYLNDIKSKLAAHKDFEGLFKSEENSDSVDFNSGRVNIAILSGDKKIVLKKSGNNNSDVYINFEKIDENSIKISPSSDFLNLNDDYIIFKNAFEVLKFSQGVVLEKEKVN